ncbi:MAG: ArsJ-associated glyceraldehyde-3-phosphate dehydrogenase, partial [Cellvibrionaceae bacterium]|nr:ArsJ-associated glyceraldehyde-3-phosphate dehydrogenase [Cellvibrionaceae bacterium]
DAECMGHLLAFDSVHGRWNKAVIAGDNSIDIDGCSISCSHNRALEDTDWSDCDIVIEASGKFKSQQALAPYLKQGVKSVVVTAPVKEPEVLNVVMGVNDSRYEPGKYPIVTAASCTTNCLAPLVKVVQAGLGIVHGSFTTIHDITNTQSILDTPHKDLRRARASSLSLIPTTTGSATAIMEIYPELKGRLDGHAVRVPLANASLTDCVFELERDTTVDEVNALFSDAAKGELAGILGYEARPLVSVDFRTDPRSSVLDALSTRVINGRHLKLYAWYDNEWGYANRSAELARLVAGGLSS